MLPTSQRFITISDQPLKEIKLAMTTLAVFEYDDQGIRFEDRNGQVWVSLTDMAKATGKRVNNWLQLASTHEYLAALLGMSIDEFNAAYPAMPQPQGFGAILTVTKGGNVQESGTWATEEVAIDFAQWCNVKFRIWVNRKIKELFNNPDLANA